MSEDLESKIAGWRRRMNTAMPDRSPAVDELEDHLRTEIGRLMAAGQEPTAAFDAALQRIGDPRTIADDFERVGRPWLSLPLSVRVIQVLFALPSLAMIIWGLRGYFSGRVEGLLVTHGVTITIGYLSVLAMGFVGLVALVKASCGRLPPRQRWAFKRCLFQLTLASALMLPPGLMLGMVWAAENLGQAWSWAPVEVGALVVTVASVTMLIAQARRVSDRFQWTVAALGNGAVLVAIIAAERPQSAVPFGWVCLAFVATLAGLVLLRPSADPGLAVD